MLALSAYTGLQVKEYEHEETRRTVEESASYVVVRPGEIVFNPMWAYRGAVAVSRLDHAGIVSPAYYVLRPRLGVDARLLAYLLGSVKWRQTYAAMARGLTTYDRSVKWDDLAAAPVVLPGSSDEQARTADFLDRECAQLEDLRSEIYATLTVLDEELDRAFGDVTRGRASGTIPMRRLITSISDGPFGSSLASVHYTDAEEVRVVRLGGIGRGEFRHGDRAYVPAEYASAVLGDHCVFPGDVLVAGLGDRNHPLGRACVLPEGLGPAIHKADCYRVTVDSSLCDPEFLALALSFGPARQVAPLLSRGSTRSRLNTVVARDLPIPAVERSLQAKVVEDFVARRVKNHDLRNEYALLDDRLVAYREALIAEAVSGELDLAAKRDAETLDARHSSGRADVAGALAH